MMQPGARTWHVLCCWLYWFRYGLLGLLHVIRMSEPDLTMLALGTDLTGLGLNLNSPDPLYKVGADMSHVLRTYTRDGWLQQAVKCMTCVE